MGSHPLNLALRFMLELAALGSAGFWGYNQTNNWFRFVLATGIPILMMILWVTFAVPDDPSRSGNAPVVTPGIIRLLLEFIFFAFAAWALYNLDYSKLSLVFGFIVIVHYALSYDRIWWLISKPIS